MNQVTSFLEVQPVDSVNWIGSNNVVLWDTDVFQFTWNLLPFVCRSQLWLIVNFSGSSGGNGSSERRDSDLLKGRGRANEVPLSIFMYIDTASSIDAGDTISIAHVDLLARASHLLPIIAPSLVDLVVSVDYPDGAVVPDRGPHGMARKVNPFTLAPEKNLLLGIHTNIFVFTSSWDLSQFPWELSPLAANADSKIDIIVWIGSNNCLIVGDVNCVKRSIELDPSGISDCLCLSVLFEGSALHADCSCCLNANSGNQ